MLLLLSKSLFDSLYLCESLSVLEKDKLCLNFISFLFDLSLLFLISFSDISLLFILSLILFEDELSVLLNLLNILYFFLIGILLMEILSFSPLISLLLSDNNLLPSLFFKFNTDFASSKLSLLSLLFLFSSLSFLFSFFVFFKHKGQVHI